MTSSDIVSTSVLPSTGSPLYSVIVPFFNESQAASVLLQEILSVLEQLDGASECLCIDDASSDGTSAILDSLASEPDSLIRVIRFSNNRGQASALYRGLMEARGDIIITMDGDGQNDPFDIPLLLKHLQGVDLVCGIRSARNDSVLRKVMSRIANKIRSRVLGDGMQDSGCALKVMRKGVVSALLPIRTLYSFIPALAISAGFRLAEVPVHHRSRLGGVSNYGLRAFAVMPLIDMLGLKWYKNRCILKAEDCKKTAC